MAGNMAATAKKRKVNHIRLQPDYSSATPAEVVVAVCPTRDATLPQAVNRIKQGMVLCPAAENHFAFSSRAKAA